ncbi:MAG: CRTAC1 family protein, partial [Thermoanaerobaculia bacterium]
ACLGFLVGCCLSLPIAGRAVGQPPPDEPGKATMEPGAPMVPSGLHLDPVAAQALASDGPSFEGTPPPGIAAESSAFRFQDVAAEAGVRFRYTFGDYAYDNILESSGSGATWIDHDLDGDMDLYLLNGVYIEGVSDPKGMRSFGQASDHFYCNSGDGTFVDCTDRVGLGSHDWSMGAVAGDYDEDGYPDIFLATYGANRLFHNNGDGTFTDVASELGLVGPRELNGFVKWSVGGSWFDYDRDGDLDLAVCNFLAFDPHHLHPGKEWEMPDPKEYDGQESKLYEQRPDGKFVDVTERAGLKRPDSKCMGITVLDFDRDGHLDIFQGNDHQENFLFRARGDGTFEEVGLVAGVAVNDAGLGTGSMHGSPGDFDGDGKIDLLVVDLRHGSLYRKVNPTLFEDVTWASGVGGLLDGLGQWGAGLVDLDLDGDLDLFTTNGVAHILVGQYPVLAANDGRGQFKDARAGAGPYFSSRRSGRGAAFGDYDNDGDLDIVVNHVDHQATASLLRNDSLKSGSWLGLRLVGGGPKTSHGAFVEVSHEGPPKVRVHQPAAGYLSGNDPRIHLGVGEAERIDSVTVHWPSGRTQSWLDLEPDRYWMLWESRD